MRSNNPGKHIVDYIINFIPQAREGEWILYNYIWYCFWLFLNLLLQFSNLRLYKPYNSFGLYINDKQDAILVKNVLVEYICV